MAAFSENFPSTSVAEFNEQVEGEQKCILCGQALTDAKEKVKLTQKGCNRINKVSEQLEDDITAHDGQFVHRTCRCSYTNPRVISAKLKLKDSPHVSPRKRRSVQMEVDHTTTCLFCGKGEKTLKKRTGKGNPGQLMPVRILQFQETVQQHCTSRSDSWGRQVRARLEYIQDCVTQEVVYHVVCYSNFWSKLSIPMMFSDNEPPKKKPCSERIADTARSEAFDSVAGYLQEADRDKITVPDLVQMMSNSLEDTGFEAYTAQTMKKKVIKCFSDEIFFVQAQGHPDVVSLKRTATTILRDFFKHEQCSSEEEEKLRVIRAASDLIRCDILAMESSKNVYPNTTDILNHTDSIPMTLRIFLQHMIRRKDAELKVSAIGQAIAQLLRPYTLLAPLQIGLAVQLHKTFRSRFLIETLNHLGFSSSYYEVKKFQVNAAAFNGVDLPETPPENTIQFVADKMDHNTATIDGTNTFHGMGIIAAVTPAVSKPRQIPRTNATLQDVQAIGKIGVHFHRSDWKGLSAHVFLPVPETSTEDSTHNNLDLLWKISWPLKSPRPAWNGMMQSVLHKHEHPGQSAIFFLPMIDMSAGDMSCVYSTLKFICSQAQKQNATPVVTFDQPLYLKALSIISAEDSDVKSVVLRLGTFHLQMSFLGAVGYLMSGSGLQEILELVYAPYAVPHILTGKAYARAVRGHLLVDAALNALVTADAFQVPQILVTCQEEGHTAPGGQEQDSPHTLAEALHLSSCEPGELSDLLEEDVGNENLKVAKKLLEDVLKCNISVEEAAGSETLHKISHQLQQHREHLLNCRTA